MWAMVFFELTVIIIVNLLFGSFSVGRDINTISFYGVLLHLFYMLFYFYGIDVSEYHNNTAKGLNGLIVLRLFYLGNREILARIAIIEFSKKSLLAKRWFINSYINGLTVAVFAMCAIPLSTLIYLINTDKMRVTGIAIILFSFYIAINSAKKIVASGSTEADSPVSATRKDGTAMMTEEEFTIFDLRTTLKILGAFIVVLMAAFPATINHYQKLFFDMGYASGFTDAKSNAAPKKEANFETAVKCVMESNTRMPKPPGKGCLDRK
jgi:hypothetical protein